jgi:cobalt-zinc-cadmium resistance protein CzcA
LINTRLYIKTAYTFDKTNIYYNYDQNNLASNNEPLKIFERNNAFLSNSLWSTEKGKAAQ